jgi:hypothetical protein
MHGTDHLYGSFENFHTDLQQLEDSKWRASALGYSAEHTNRDQALNDLNEKLQTAITKGELRPDM